MNWISNYQFAIDINLRQFFVNVYRPDKTKIDLIRFDVWDSLHDISFFKDYIFMYFKTGEL